MPNWNTNFNDTVTGDSATAVLSGSHSASAATVALSSCPVFNQGGLNTTQGVRVGSTFTISGDSTVYEVTTVTDDTGGFVRVGVTPVLAVSGASLLDVTLAYGGTHGSVGNHLRLRNQGII